MSKGNTKRCEFTFKTTRDKKRAVGCRLGGLCPLDWAGRIFCIIGTDGTLYPCDRISYGENLANCYKMGFRQAFSLMPAINCSGCGFCGVLELNFLMSLRLDALRSIFNVVK